MLQEHARTLTKIPAAFDPLMVPRLHKLKAVVEPGLTKLTWTSLTIDSYIEVSALL